MWKTCVVWSGVYILVCWSVATVLNFLRDCVHEFYGAEEIFGVDRVCFNDNDSPSREERSVETSSVLVHLRQ
jgi:hypothetical protein